MDKWTGRRMVDSPSERYRIWHTPGREQPFTITETRKAASGEYAMRTYFFYKTVEEARSHVTMLERIRGTK